MDYTCTKCYRSSPEVTKSKVNSYCNKCKLARDNEAARRRIGHVDRVWDSELSAEWLFKTTGGYCLELINHIRSCDNKEPIQAEGFYIWSKL